jgi:hypothetical protein
VRGIPFWASLYADNIILFLSSVPGDLQITRTIFNLFWDASGLAYNMGKCQILPICYSADQLLVVSNMLPCPVVEFPVKYLGIPLALGKLSRSALEQILEKAVNALSAWKGHLMQKSGWLMLVRSTLSIMPNYMAISLHLPSWL